MTVTNPDAATCDCHAWGCNMLGTSTRSTTGGKDWLCWLHMAAEPSRWQAITAELNRLSWLVAATRLIREHHDKPTFKAISAEIYKSIALAQRSDLQQQDHEYPQEWGIRLEGILAASCASAMAPAELQPETP